MVACLAALSFSGLAAAGEEATTYRAGDLTVYLVGCHDAASMIAIAERAGANELVAVLIERGACFQSPMCIAARLERWIAGPYAPDHGLPGGPAGSVWRVADQFGDTEYVWINDEGGQHESEPSRGI